ncbi:MAG: holo-ACP synthase [Peptococcales bacterium]|jgi:holo-[acyl-carrier protein] synthase
MIIGIGTDIVEIDRLKKAIENRPKMVERVFTRIEIDYSEAIGNIYTSLAARFAAKEAVAKALGTGFRNFKWQDIEVYNDNLGKPGINIYGKALEKAQELGVARIFVSLSHCRDYAVATVVLEGEK